MAILDKVMPFAEIPYENLQGNLLLAKSGHIWAYYRVFPEETNPNNFEEMEKYKRRWESVFRKTLPPYTEFELYEYPKDMQLKQRFDEHKAELSPDFKALGIENMNRTIEGLTKELGELTSPDFILGVRLKDMYDNENPLESIKRVTDDVSEKLLILLGKKETQDFSVFERVKPLEEELYRVLKTRKSVRLTEEETIYANRFPFIRGMEHDWKQESRNKDRIGDTIVDGSKDSGFIHLSNDLGRSVVSFLPIAEFEKQDISYNHLFQFAGQMGFPCEFRMKAHYPDKDGFYGLNSKVMMQKNRHKSEARETRRAGDVVSERTLKLGAATTELANEVENGEPIAFWMGCFVVTGKTVKQCKRRGEALINALASLKVQVARPSAKQLQLFYYFLPGAATDSLRDWKQVSNGRGLAETLFAVTNQVGTKTGTYLGRVDPFIESETLRDSIRGSRNLVLYNILLANQGQEKAVTDSPHVAITGETGKGKSYLTGILFFSTALLNCKVLYIDPKNQVAKQFRRTAMDKEIRRDHPEFVRFLHSINYVTLDATKKANHGVLDPIVFLHGVDAKDTSQAMIQSIYNLENREEVETAINEEIDKVIEERELGQKVGLLTVVRRLMEDEDIKIQRAGKLLFSKVQNSILHLGFSDGHSNGLDLNQDRTVLGVAGLSLPEPHVPAKEYTEANKKSVCLMLPLGKFCERFGNQDDRQYTVEFFDEAWIFAKAKGGREILKSMQRVGRSFCNILVYSTQSVNDVKDDQNTSSFGTMFAFDWQAEREAILGHVGIEVSPRNLRLVENMKKGQCLFRDIYGRTAKLSIHNLFPEWDHALQTVEKTASSQAERKFT